MGHLVPPSPRSFVVSPIRHTTVVENRRDVNMSGLCNDQIDESVAAPFGTSAFSMTVIVESDLCIFVLDRSPMQTHNPSSELRLLEGFDLDIAAFAWATRFNEEYLYSEFDDA